MGGRDDPCGESGRHDLVSLLFLPDPGEQRGETA